MIVVASKPGQLGNSLFLFANFIACAIENNFSIANPAFDEYSEFFETTRVDFFCRYPACNSFFAGGKFLRKALYTSAYYAARVLVKGRIESEYLRTISIDWEEQMLLNSPEFLAAVKDSKLVFAQGWLFRDRKNLRKHADAIRAYFAPLESFDRHVEALIAKTRERCDVLIGVHIRHGDYKAFMDGKYFYEIDEYVKLMRAAERLFPSSKVCFLICSNANLRAEDFSAFNFTFGTNHFVEDMYSFARCDYLIGPPSTYTMWASYYGKVPLYMIEDLNAPIEFDDAMAFIGN